MKTTSARTSTALTSGRRDAAGRARERMTHALRDAGCRITRQRTLIIDHLVAADGVHPSARQIYESVRGTSGPSMATVYNTLGTLARAGQVKILEFESGDNRYELNVDPHVNLICRSCGEIADLDKEMVVHRQTAERRRRFQVDDCRLEYYGLCAACRGSSGTA